MVEWVLMIRAIRTYSHRHVSEVQSRIPDGYPMAGAQPRSAACHFAAHVEGFTLVP
jgi:hypothetical protein